MEYFREMTESAAVDAGVTSVGYNFQAVSAMESAIVVGSWIAAGGCGPGLHYHTSDQVYFLIRGQMNVQLGTEVHNIGPSTFVHIPAGLAHRNWNDGSEQEFHFEMIIPRPGPIEPLFTPVENPSDAPLQSGGSITPLDREKFVTPEGFTGFALQDLLISPKAHIRVAEVSPGKSGPGMHIHEFDQYFYVLEGTLDVEVALQKRRVEAGMLVVLPAGVPHRQYNSGDTAERHIAINTPGPEAGRPWDYGVDFCANGHDLYGITAKKA